MGVEQVKLANKENAKEMQHFMRHLLNDVKALEYMLENDWFETGIKRIGAEQEMCLVDKHCKPHNTNMAIMDKFSPDWLTTELGQFNLECNLTPQEYKGDALRVMENELRSYIGQLRQEAAKQGSEVLLTGILPTLRKTDLALENLTPKPRYRALMMALRNLRGTDHEVHLDGIDELTLTHDSPLLEACNTSFQVHLQVTPANFVQMYNIALAIAGPSLAIAANSPLLFGKRLWHETRIVLFQQSIDTRTTMQHIRERSPRVTFGNDWLRNSILDIYREDIARFRVIMTSEEEEEAFEKIKKGEAPKLRALQVHNSTVYRWNRPCYGISPNGKPHLRIENRILPSGPTIIDEMANTAFWVGLMEGVASEYGDVTKLITFDDARDNFVKGARTGIDSEFTWLGNKKISAKEILLKELLPLAKKGLEDNHINKDDISRYLDVIEGRAKNHATGARWILRSYSNFIKETSKDEAIAAVTASMLKNQLNENPVHTWELPSLDDLVDYNPAHIRVEEFMTTDLFTVRAEDVLEFTAQIMDWRKLRYLPVEDENGQLVGLITSKLLLSHFAGKPNPKIKTVGDIMLTKLVTATLQDTVIDIINIMNEKGIGCIPVVDNGQLVGVVTEKNFLDMSKRLIQRMGKSE